MSTEASEFRATFVGPGGRPIELVAGRHFLLDRHCFGQHLRAALSGRMVDLLRIATTVYLIDRLSKRSRSAPDGWPRWLRVSIEVHDPEFWSGDPVRGLLGECVDFVGGDGWEFQFTPDPSGRPACHGGWLDFDDPLVVCLYSGGLDSAAGLAERLRRPTSRQIIPVLVRHHTGQRRLVERQLAALSGRYGVGLKPLVPVVWTMAPSRLLDEEASQRCRPFLFAAAGGVAAWMSGAAGVEVYESGVGAVNLPLMAGMVGSKATKSSHPNFLRLMSRLLTTASGREISFRLPYLDRTKAEVVRTLAEDGLDDVARSTASCVHYPLREAARKQCGACPACIFRRQAMITAGIEEPADAYKYALFGPAGVVNRIDDRRLAYLKAFLMQVEKLADLDGRPAIPRFFRRHLVGTGVVAQGEPLAPYVELYRRYRSEWLALVARGRAEGWTWAEMLAPAGAPAS